MRLGMSQYLAYGLNIGAGIQKLMTNLNGAVELPEFPTHLSIECTRFILDDAQFLGVFLE